MGIFSSIVVPRPKRSKFNLSHEVKLTTEFGRLTPFFCEPVLPGDSFRVSTNLLLRMAPLVAPVMQRFSVSTHFYFVPNRLIWSGWEDFITGGEDGVTRPAYPRIKVPENIGVKYTSESSLMDYLGFVPQPYLTTIHNDSPVNELDALPFRAYQLIYNEYYRDQNLSPEIDILKDYEGIINEGRVESSKIVDLLTLRNRAWRKDYFTSALPDPQRGPDVRLPINTDGSIQYNSQSSDGIFGDYWHTEANVAPTATQGEVNIGSYTTPNGQKTGVLGVGDSTGTGTNSAGNRQVSIDNSHHLQLSDATSSTINEVRRAFALQRWYERSARAGSRYIEQILAHFGVRSSDARLQRPEYLGGSVVPIFIGDVLQTSESTENGTPLATPAGVGSAVGTVKQFKRHFEEHGWIIGILSVTPSAAYCQGTPRKFLKWDWTDYGWPLFANLGEQAIYKREIYENAMEQPTREDLFSEFGYAPRYSEYKFINSSVHGDFRYNLDYWHDSRLFNSTPALNKEFIEVTPDPSNEHSDMGLNRIFAVTDSDVTDHLWVQMYNDVTAIRPLPKYGTPI